MEFVYYTDHKFVICTIDIWSTLHIQSFDTEAEKVVPDASSFQRAA